MNPNKKKNNCQVPLDKHPLLSDIENIKDVNDLNKQDQQMLNVFSTYSATRKLQGGLLQRKDTKNARVNPNKKSEIQGLYNSQKHRAVQEIFFGPTKFCMISKDVICTHFVKKFGKTPDYKTDLLKPSSNTNNNNGTNNNNLIRPFTNQEVKTKLKAKINCKLSNSRSVGIDQISFSKLLRVDPDCKLLTAFYNACLRVQSVPKSWNETYSVLVLKTDYEDEENKDDISNKAAAKKLNEANIKHWRTITMYNTIPKLFYALLAARLCEWSISNSKISNTQRSYLLDNAACEMSFILQECKNNARRNNQDLVMAWLNFNDCSETVPQEAVRDALRMHGVPQTIFNIVDSMFKQDHTRFRIWNGFTDLIKINNGMHQGNPMNPVLLNLVMEPILRKLTAAKDDSLQLYSQKLNHFVIPNELVLFSNSDEKLKNLLKSVDETSRLLGFRFKTNKSLALHYSSDGNVNKDAKFIFGSQKLCMPTEEKINTLFGVKQGLSIGQDEIPTIEEMMKSIQLIDNSQLDGYQKIDSVGTFIYPRIENCLRGVEEVKDELPKLVAADEFLSDKVRHWLKLPDTLSPEIMALPKEFGGAEFIPLKDLINVMKIVQSFKMLTSELGIVKSIAHDSLCIEISMKLNKPVNKIGTTEMTKYLSGTLKIINDHSNYAYWQTVRDATVDLKSKVNLSWSYSESHKEIQLIIKDMVSGKKRRSVTLRGNFRSNVAFHLKTRLIKFYINQFNTKNPDWQPPEQAPKPRFGYRKPYAKNVSPPTQAHLVQQVAILSIN